MTIDEALQDRLMRLIMEEEHCGQGEMSEEVKEEWRMVFESQRHRHPGDLLLGNRLMYPRGSKWKEM